MFKNKINLFKNYNCISYIKHFNLFNYKFKKYFKYISYHEVPDEILEYKYENNVKKRYFK